MKLPQNLVTFFTGGKILKYRWELRDPWIAREILIEELLIKTQNKLQILLKIHNQYGSSTQRTHALKRGPRNKVTRL